MRNDILLNDKEYIKTLDDIKNRISEAQRNARVSVNKELIMLYWYVGKIINEKSTWGNKFVENLERDIRLSYPKMKGFSKRNLWYMVKFANEYPDEQIVQPLAAQLPWTHHTIILDATEGKDERIWYIKKSVESGWSKRVLIHQIENNVYKRQVATSKINNFKKTLPSPQSELAEQITKDPYFFDFVANSDDMYETQLENALVDNVAKLLLELGTGFAFIGNQYHMEIGDEDFYIDMLFYNLKLHCYVVVELKNTKFKPEYTGKLNFYLSAVDSILKTENDNPTIGLLLCKGKNNVIAEYALRDMAKPMGVSAYKLLDTVPKDLENILPSAEDIKTRLGGGKNDK